MQPPGAPAPEPPKGFSDKLRPSLRGRLFFITIDMNKQIVIRENIPAYMAALEKWLADTADTPLEEMAAFFTARLGTYETHMSLWREAYKALPALLPSDTKTLLDRIVA